MAAIPYWFHAIDVGHGIITPGFKSAPLLQKELASLSLPDLHGKTVLDIGAWDGFYSFEAERRGATRVVALDHYMWSLDPVQHVRYVAECKAQGVSPKPYHLTPNWKPDELPGKVAFDTARELLGSKVQSVVADFMTTDLISVGTFDVVLYLGVLYHMEHPFLALQRLAQVTREVAVIETEAIIVDGLKDAALVRFIEGSELDGDVSNWWAPTAAALAGMCRAAGFASVDLLTPEPKVQAPRSLTGRVRRRLRGVRPTLRRYRLIAHARK